MVPPGVGKANTHKYGGQGARGDGWGLTGVPQQAKGGARNASHAHGVCTRGHAATHARARARGRGAQDPAGAGAITLRPANCGAGTFDAATSQPRARATTHLHTLSLRHNATRSASRSQQNANTIGHASAMCVRWSVPCQQRGSTAAPSLHLRSSLHLPEPRGTNGLPRGTNGLVPKR